MLNDAVKSMGLYDNDNRITCFRIEEQDISSTHEQGKEP